MNYCRRHSYYVGKFIKWLELNGYIADKCEYSGMIGQQYTKRDLWGADVIFRSQSEIGFIQVKTSESQISKGKRQLCSDNMWPPFVQRIVGYWPPRAKSPNLTRVNDVNSAI